MPIYGYACRNCDHRLDVLQKIAAAPLTDCPSCGEPELKRLLSAPRFRLKGQGWYETDFKKDNQRNLHGDKEPAKKDDKTSSDESSTATMSSDKASKDKKDKSGTSTSTSGKKSGTG